MKPLLPSVALCLFMVAPAQPEEIASVEEVVLAMIEAINSRHLDALDQMVSDDVQRHCDATPGLEITTLDQFKAFLGQDFVAVPNSSIEVNQIFSAADMVAVHATYSGTQSGQSGPFPPSNKHGSISFISTLRVEGGKVAEIWVEWDNLSLLMQWGHITPVSLFGGDAGEASG